MGTVGDGREDEGEREERRQRARESETGRQGGRQGGDDLCSPGPGRKAGEVWR